MSRPLYTANHWGTYRVETCDGRVVALHGLETDPSPSPIGYGAVDTLRDACRIPRPMVRRRYLEHGPAESPRRRGADAFVAVSWEEAEALVAGEIERVRKTYGNRAIFAGSYGWASAGKFHHGPSQLQRFLNCLGGFTRSLNTYSFAAGEVILPHVVGDMFRLLTRHTPWASIAGHGRLVVAFGGLPLKNAQINMGGSVHHGQGDDMRTAHARGVRFVNVSPVRSDTMTELGAEWIALRPNTDVALMLGLAHTLLEEGLHDRAFLDRYCVGADAFIAYLTGERDGTPKSAAWASGIAEVEAETIRRLARRMAAERTMISLSWSLTRQHHGEQPFWMGVALAAMLGHIGLPGGGVGFGYSAINGIGRHCARLPWAGLDRGRYAIPDFIPVARIADLLLGPGRPFDYNGKRYEYPDIKLVYWVGGNPFHHHQDLNRLVRAWQRPETVIVHEPWWNALARHADIVLPATTPLERNDIVASPRDGFAVASAKACEPFSEARDDHRIFASLARRFGVADAFTEGREEMDWLRHIYDVSRQRAAAEGHELPGFEEFWARGIVEVPAPAEHLILFGEFRADPSAHPLPTPSGRIEIYSETIAGFGYDDCPAHPSWMEPVEWLGGAAAARYPLHLLSHQPSTRLHSQLDNGATSRAGKLDGRERVTLHPEDAAARGIDEGDVVRVFSPRGSCLAAARISDEVRRGVVTLPTGAWYDPAPGTDAGLCKHGNPNVLTLDRGTSKLAQGPIAHTCLVEVEALADAAPEVTAFVPPEIIDEAT